MNFYLTQLTVYNVCSLWDKSFVMFSQYMRHNSAVLVAFAEVVKLTDHTTLWDAKLASPSATLQISRLILSGYYSSDLSLWLRTQPENSCFLAYFTLPDHQGSCILSDIITVMVNCIFTFYITNVFGYFSDIMAQFKFVKDEFPN